MLNIRNETPADYQAVEALTRRAFYNLYVPGCHEHYLAHIMRSHPDFVPELDFVLELDGEAARRFDEGLPPMDKRVLPCQEEFYILSHSVLR